MVNSKLPRIPKIKAAFALPIRFGKKQSEVSDAFSQLTAKDSSGKIVSLQMAKSGTAAQPHFCFCRGAIFS